MDVSSAHSTVSTPIDNIGAGVELLGTITETAGQLGIGFGATIAAVEYGEQSELTSIPGVLGQTVGGAIMLGGAAVGLLGLGVSETGRFIQSLDDTPSADRSVGGE